MRWATVTVKPGDIRHRRAFTWLPLDCSDGTTRWFEWVLVTEIRESGWWDSDWWRVLKTVPVVPQETEG